MTWYHEGKKYKLLKDLPTFRADDQFELRDDGCLYWVRGWRNPDEVKHWSKEVMAYHRKTLERFPNILEDWFEEIKPDTCYWFINDLNGNLVFVSYTERDFFEIAEARKKIGNYFRTAKEAEKAKKKLEALTRLEEKGFRFVEHQIHGMTEDGEGDGCVYFEFDKPLDKKDLDLLFGGEE